MRRAPVFVPDLAAVTWALAYEAGIPEPHLDAVVERAQAARRAVLQLDGHDILGGAVHVLASRIVTRALADHGRGVLERRLCYPRG